MSSFFRKTGKYFSKSFNKTKNPTEIVENLKTPINDASQAIVKESLKTKAVTYVKNVVKDYGDVGKESIKYVSDNPFKSLGYGLITTSLVIFYKNTPTMTDYENARKCYSNEMIMCGSTYSKRSEYYLNELKKLENGGFLEYKSFVIFSMILVKRFNETESVYEGQCDQLNNPNKYNVFNLFNQSLKFLSRIIDFGFCNEWYFLNKRLKDYDVNEEEWNTNVKSK
jgi:hypothetical protein